MQTELESKIKLMNDAEYEQFLLTKEGKKYQGSIRMEMLRRIQPDDYTSLFIDSLPKPLELLKVKDEIVKTITINQVTEESLAELFHVYSTSFSEGNLVSCKVIVPNEADVNKVQKLLDDAIRRRPEQYYQLFNKRWTVEVAKKEIFMQAIIDDDGNVTFE